jgi:hypothetical protein
VIHGVNSLILSKNAVTHLGAINHARTHASYRDSISFCRTAQLKKSFGFKDDRRGLVVQMYALNMP